MILKEKLWKQYVNQKKLFSLQIYHIIYFLFGWLRVWYCLKQFWQTKALHILQKFDVSVYICPHHSFNKHIQCLPMSKSNLVLTAKQILIRTLLSQGADSTWYQLLGCLENISRWVITQFVKDVLYVPVKRIVQANISKQKHEISVKNAMLMSAKTVLSKIIRIVSQKRNWLYDIFAMTIAFSSFYFVFTVFLLIFYLF